MPILLLLHRAGGTFSVEHFQSENADQNQNVCGNFSASAELWSETHLVSCQFAWLLGRLPWVTAEQPAAALALGSFPGELPQASQSRRSRTRSIWRTLFSLFLTITKMWQQAENKTNKQKNHSHLLHSDVNLFLRKSYASLWSKVLLFTQVCVCSWLKAARDWLLNPLHCHCSFLSPFSYW